MILRMDFRPLRLGLLLSLLASAQVSPAQPAASDPARRENASVRADRAWEDPDADAVHVQGHVEMRAERWELAADAAVLHGALDAPDRVLAEGSPARMRFTDGVEQAHASGERLEYQREGGRIALSGRAELRRGADHVAGGRIEYWRDTDRFSAGGEGRVRGVISPGAKRSAPGSPGDPPPR